MRQPFHIGFRFKDYVPEGPGLSLLVLRARANRGCPVILREGNKRAHWRAMVTINSLNYALIIHNYSRLADKHKPTEIISQGET